MVPLVLVHGLIGSLDDEALRDALAPRVTLAPDLLGYGERVGVTGEQIDVDAQVAELTRALDAAEATTVHLLGHSVGWVIAALVAARHETRVASVTCVEGNFTLADAFWSASFARLAPHEAERVLAEHRADPGGWLRGAGVDPDARTLRLAQRWLDFQPASTVQAMAASVVEVTGHPAYEQTLRRVFARTPVHLVSGERSRSSWSLPAWALSQARSFTTLPGGHLMMATDPGLFGRTINDVIER